MVGRRVHHIVLILALVQGGGNFTALLLLAKCSNNCAFTTSLVICYFVAGALLVLRGLMANTRLLLGVGPAGEYGAT